MGEFEERNAEVSGVSSEGTREGQGGFEKLGGDAEA